MTRVKAKAPQQFKPQVLDTEKRLNILFDHLNNEDLLKPETVAEMGELARAMDERRHDDAQSLFTDLMTNHTEEGSNWMVSEFCYLCLHGRVLFPRKRRKFVLNKNLQRRIAVRIEIVGDGECGRVAPMNRDEESADDLLGRSQEAHSDEPRDAVVSENPAEDRFVVCESLGEAWSERAEEEDQGNEKGWKVGELVHKEVITLRHIRDMSNTHVWNELISCWQRKRDGESVRE
jgi:hypothetical protein